MNGKPVGVYIVKLAPMRFFFTFFLCFLCFLEAKASELRLDMQGFVEQALRVDPRIREQRLGKITKELQIDAIKAGVILPKLELSMLFGPAPGLKNDISGGDTVETWDFTKMGPFFGVDFKVVQPLNLGQLHKGLQAARADLRQTELDIAHKELRKVVELQEYYYGYLLAMELNKLVQDAHKQLTKAHDQMEEALEEDDETVSQRDLLEIKAGFFEVEKNKIDAATGLRKAQLAIRFALGLDDSVTFIPFENALVERTDAVPPLDSLKRLSATINPELMRLEAGLRALHLQMDLATAKLGPEFFIMGDFTYAKSWAGDRNTINRDAFSQDPVNQISGAVGLGVRYKLNIWNSWEGFRKARADYRLLKHKESYATQGIALQVEEKYLDWEAARDKLESVRRSLQATEGILKGVALQYEIDPSQSDALVDAYKKNLYMKKDYYFAVYNYNIAVSTLFSQVGLSPAGDLRISQSGLTSTQQE